MICLRHRSASGDVSNCWEFDPKTRRVHVSFVLGRRSYAFGVEVCAADRLKLGAHPMHRLNEESWRIVPERVIRTWRNRIERLETIRCPPSDLVGFVTLAITNAPPDVVRQFEAL